MMKCGGLAEAKVPNTEVIEICNKIRPELEAKLGETLPTYEVISYRPQVVNGVNYFVKIHVGNGRCIHVRAYRAFSGETNLHGFQDNKTHTDELEYVDMF